MLGRVLSFFAAFLLATACTDTRAYAYAHASGLKNPHLGFIALGLNPFQEKSPLSPSATKEKTLEIAAASIGRGNYLRARYMDPSQGRLLGMDAFEGAHSDPRTLHRYNYVLNRPTSLVDPTGEFGIPELTAGIDASFTLTTGGSTRLPGHFVDRSNNDYARHLAFGPMNPGIASQMRVVGRNIFLQITLTKFNAHSIADETALERAKEGIQRFWNTLPLKSPGHHVFSITTSIHEPEFWGPTTITTQWGSRTACRSRMSPDGSHEMHVGGAAHIGGDNIIMCANSNARTAAHEFGHILGFKDQYLSNGTTPIEYADDMMGNGNDRVVKWYHALRMIESRRVQ